VGALDSCVGIGRTLGIRYVWLWSAMNTIRDQTRKRLSGLRLSTSEGLVFISFVYVPTTSFEVKCYHDDIPFKAHPSG
jgi:hypothetical protein